MQTDIQFDLTPTITAIADPTRREVLGLLSEKPHRASDLALTVGTSPSSMSKHLKVLMQAGLVIDERPVSDSRVRIFHLKPDGLTATGQWLASLEAEWRRQLAAFKQHIEER